MTKNKKTKKPGCEYNSQRNGWKCFLNSTEDILQILLLMTKHELIHYFELVSKFRNKIWLTTYMFVNTDCSCQMNHNSKKDHYCIFFSNDGICTCIAVQIPMSIGKRFTGWYNRVAVLKKLNKYYHKRLRKFLCQDLRIGMSFYFIIMLHHIHLSL